MSKRSEERRNRAEDVCKQLREDIASCGGMTRRTLRYFFWWMSKAGYGAYKPPRKIRRRTWQEIQKAKRDEGVER